MIPEYKKGKIEFFTFFEKEIIIFFEKNREIFKGLTDKDISEICRFNL